MNILRTSFLILFCFFNITSTFCQWTKGTGVVGGKVNALILKGPQLFAGTDTGGVFVSNDYGLNWATSNTGLDNHNITSFCVKNNVLIAGIGNGFSTGNIFLSNNNGGNWAASTGKYYGFLFSLANFNNDVLAGSWYGVLRSTDNGNTWTTLPTTGLPSNASVTGLACTSTSIFAGVSGSSTGGTGVFSSSNNGTTWSAKNNGLTNTTVNCLALSSSRLFAGTTSGVFVSGDEGANWVAAGLPTHSIYTLVNRGNNLIAGTSLGIFYSPDNGVTWNSLSTGLPAGTKVYSITHNDTYLYIGTGSDCYRRPLSDFTGIAEVSHLNRSITISPNPSLGNFNLEFSAQVEEAEIQILNSLGQEIYSGLKTKNENQIAFDFTGLNKGIYYVKVKMGDAISCKKFWLE